MTTLDLLVRTIRYEAPDVIAIELVDPAGRPLPDYGPGAHLDVALPNGLGRSYSLFEPSGGGSYWVAVLKDRSSRGGSRWLHDDLRVGTTLPVTAPSNNFPLVDETAPTVLIAGGIGITPMLAHLQALVAAGNRRVAMLYATRTRTAAAFLDRVERLADGGGVALSVHADDEHGGPPDLESFLGRFDRGVHAYCCGPPPMLDGFEAAGSKLGLSSLHIERFTAVEAVAGDGALDAFDVELRASGVMVRVEGGQSILAQVKAAGIAAPHSCQEGVCGTCEVTVLDGEPDHRDGVLTTEEREAGDTMMICVSGSKTPLLVIDA